MKKTLLLLAAAAIGFCVIGLAPALAGDEEGQAPRGPAAMFELKMRILAGSRETAARPARPVTASFLKFQNLVNFDLAEDVQAEQRIKALYNLKELNLVTEAPLVWEKGKAEKAIHMFRLNGQEYLVLVTPGRLVDKNQFRIEVYEQAGDRKANLLDTEFSLPDRSAAVFGFEDTALKPYFISLRIVGRGGIVSGQAAQPVGRVGGILGGGSKVMPPKLIKQVDPVYPEAARKAGVEGQVILEAMTDTYGRVAAVKVLRSIPLFDQAAIDALRQWVYEPMVVDGKPQPVSFTVTMRFRLDDKKKPQVGGLVGGVVGGVTGGVEGGIEGGVTGGVQGAVQGGVSGGVQGGVVGGVMSDEERRKFQGDAVLAINQIQPPRLIQAEEPAYPEIARQAGVKGTVILEIKTDEKGDVVAARVLRSIPLLDQAAIEAVKRWKYEPLILEGKPRKVVFTVTVRFDPAHGGKANRFAEGAVKAEGSIEPPKLVKEVQPVYPEIARQAAVEGVVILSVRTDDQGRVVDAIVLRSIPLLDQAALDAVRQWVYEPLVVKGKAEPAVFTVTVRFQLK